MLNIKDAETDRLARRLAEQPLDAAYASDLIAGANAAIACINGISA